ncbi:MAG: hypothetical protein WAW80_02885 [Candidatus Saccharimonadales bacterium]
MSNTDTLTSFAIILLAAVIHASFQLSISVLTLLSGHTLGRKSAHQRLLRLTGGFILGAVVMTALLLTFTSFVLSVFIPHATPAIVWSASCGALAGVGVSVWLFYYKNIEQGTSLWIPRNFARYLVDRSKASKVTVEAFSLGLTSVISELLFIFAPIIITSLILIRLTPDLQLLGILLYSFVSLLPLFIVGILVGGGHKLSHIQRWRETNKSFLQFASGTGLLVLGAYIYVEKVVIVTIYASGNQ